MTSRLKRIAIGAALGVVAGLIGFCLQGAHGQGLGVPCVDCFGHHQPAHALTGDADLDKAVGICDQHRAYNAILTIPDMLRYQTGFEECVAIINRWEHSEAGRRRAAQLLQEAADKAFVEQYAKGLK